MANEQQMQSDALKEHNHRWPSPNHNFVPEYQQSGIPFAKKVNSDSKVEFPSVTRWISISCANDCYINFNQSKPADIAANEYSFYIPAKTVTRFELKCKVINVKSVGDVSVYILAGLTNVPTRNFPDQTAANGFSV
jgi:hypothetical protein